jgi:uncharacterized integral membrane protein
MSDDPGAKDFPADQSKRLSNRTIVGIVIVALVLVFILINRENTKIAFVFFHAEAPLWVALALAAAGGFIAGYLVARRRHKT